MQVLYQGNYDVKTHTSKFVCKEPNVLDKFSLKFPTTFTSQILYLDSLVTGTDKVLYLLLSLNPDDNDCMACGPAFKFMAFKKTGNIWSETSENVTNGVGQMGTASDFKVKNIGKNIGFIFDVGALNMGEFDEVLIVFTYYNNTFKKIAHIEDISYTNDGNCNPKKLNSCYTYNGKIQFLDRGKDFNDILITKKGTDLRNGKVIKIDSAITYRFVDGQYMR